MKKKKAKWVVILLVLVLITIMADIAIRLSMLSEPEKSRCLEIPIKFVMENPDCADKLFKAANLTNVHIVPPGTLEAQRYNQSKLYKTPRQQSLTNHAE